jgi:hypothetical protein
LPAALAALFPKSPANAPPQTGVSADGELVAYELPQSGVADGVTTTTFTLHIYNTVTGSDYAIRGVPSINLGNCVKPFGFSDDDRYLTACGETSIAGDAIMVVIDTAQDTVIHNFDVGSASNYSIDAVGWNGVDSLVYVTNATSQNGQFNAATESGFSIDLRSGVTHDYPTGLGELLMVLH